MGGRAERKEAIELVTFLGAVIKYLTERISHGSFALAHSSGHLWEAMVPDLVLRAGHMIQLVESEAADQTS